MDTDRFIIYLKSEEIYADIPKDFKVIFGTSNYELDRQSPKEKKKATQKCPLRKIQIERL